MSRHTPEHLGFTPLAIDMGESQNRMENRQEGASKHSKNSSDEECVGNTGGGNPGVFKGEHVCRQGRTESHTAELGGMGSICYPKAEWQ